MGRNIVTAQDIEIQRQKRLAEAVWEVETYVNDEFDIGQTFDTYEEAFAQYNKEVENPYRGDWVKTWEVKLLEVHKQLITQQRNEDADGQ